MRWEGHAACLGKGRSVQSDLVGTPEGKRSLEDPDIDGRTVLNWTFRKWDGGT